MKKTTFALYFGNRGFFPESLISGARQEMKTTLESIGFGTLTMDEAMTPHGAVEGPEEGMKYAQFLKEHEGEYDGVILCLPNFGDETGAVAALRDAGVPILIQAYPDELDKMGFSHRRDAFCGKFSIMDVFCQYEVPFSVFPPHTVHPGSDTFAQQVTTFSAVCRIVNRMKRMVVGAIGARTTAFKTVRFDELTLQKYGITTETLDLSEVFLRVRSLATNTDAFKDRAERLKQYTNWDNVPEKAFETHVRLSVVLDEIISEYSMDAVSLRCWLEMEKDLKIAPCVLLGDINDRDVPAACELDVCNAIPMLALLLASGKASTCLDWNNNYGDDQNKCILFHCGPVPQSLMTAKGQVVDHPMFAKALGAGCAFGPNVGRIAPAPITYASTKTQDGTLSFYLGEGRFTDDPIADDFFGCAGVAEIPNLQDTLLHVGRGDYRHHVGVTAGHVADAIEEAFRTYLGYEGERL